MDPFLRSIVEMTDDGDVLAAHTCLPHVVDVYDVNVAYYNSMVEMHVRMMHLITTQ